MNSTQVPQSEEQEQPAKEGQKPFSLPLIKIKVLHWKRKPSKKLRLTAPAWGEQRFAEDATSSLKMLPRSHSSPQASRG